MLSCFFCLTKLISCVQFRVTFSQCFNNPIFMESRSFTSADIQLGQKSFYFVKAKRVRFSLCFKSNYLPEVDLSSLAVVNITGKALSLHCCLKTSAQFQPFKLFFCRAEVLPKFNNSFESLLRMKPVLRVRSRLPGTALCFLRTLKTNASPLERLKFSARTKILLRFDLKTETSVSHSCN